MRGWVRIPALTKKQLTEFLREPWISKIATIQEDGSPHIMPAWYEWKGGHLYVITKPFAQIVQNVRRDSRVYVLIDRPEYPYKRVSFQGKAEIVSISWSEMAKRMTLRYMGRQALKYHKERLKLPGIVIRVTPEKVSTWVPDKFPPDRTFFRPAAWRSVEPKHPKRTGLAGEGTRSRGT